MNKYLDDFICNKFGIRTKGLTRIYELPVDRRSFAIEFTEPHYFKAENFVSTESSWSKLLEEFSKHVAEHYYIDLLKFCPDWTDKPIYVKNEGKNTVKIKDGVYLIQNHTALHACWIILDLLKKARISVLESTLEIYRLPRSEPNEVRERLISNMRRDFKTFLENLGLESKKVDLIINGFERINFVFSDYISSGYNNFYLFTNMFTFSTYKNKFLKDCETKQLFSSKNMVAVKKILQYYHVFFKEICDENIDN